MEDLKSLENEVDMAMVERLQQLKTARKTKLGWLTRQKNEIKLMENICNVELVKSKLETEFLQICKENQELHESKNVLLLNEDAEKEQNEWYDSEMTGGFLDLKRG